MPDRIDTAVHAMQPPCEHTCSNRVFADPQATQLIDRDHSVLPIRNLSDPKIPLGDFPVHTPR